MTQGTHNPDQQYPESIGPYRVVRVLGVGGMGRVFLARQTGPLERDVAVKLIERGTDSARVLARFQVERQALALMNHDGIAKVFDAGTTDDGKPYFVMEYVPGVPLTDYCDKHALSIEDRIELVRRVCAGVQHAHQKGVIHRDLKPGNILVGEVGGDAGLGTPKIIDFGLARAADLDSGGPPVLPAGEGDNDAEQILGTPEYMSPEQACSGALDLDTRTDVYSLGVVLYEVLTGELPFPSAKLRRAGWQEIQLTLQEQEPPKPSTRAYERDETLARQLRGDLDLIVGKTLSKEPGRRYETAADLSADLGRYLASEPVLAGPPGVGYRWSKFVQRYRMQVASAAMVLIALLAGVITTWIFYRSASQESDAREVQRKAAVAEAERQAEQERVTLAHLDRFNRLATTVRLAEARDAASKLFPAWPEKIAALRLWLRAEGDVLVKQRPLVQRAMQELRANAEPAPDNERLPESKRRWHFESSADAFLHRTLRQLEDGLRTFESRRGLLAEVRQRLLWAKRIDELTTRHPNARATWEQARAAIRNANGVTASRLYGEQPTDLAPQTGLVPIGMNPVTKLWEFYHLRSAWDPWSDVDPATIKIPRHQPDGTIPIAERTGMVFVLIPGGTFTLGAQHRDYPIPNPNLGMLDAFGEPPHQVTLSPFLLARHEMTQGQWIRLSAGANPSSHRAGKTDPTTSNLVDLRHPVEYVSWVTCRRQLQDHGLVLPTEAQWEYGCRAGTNTRWFVGNDPADLQGVANLFDPDVRRAVQANREGATFDDGYRKHAPVGSFRANPFGLHDVHGNVQEQCLDIYLNYTLFLQAPGNGLRMVPESAMPPRRVCRGGSFDQGHRDARSCFRRWNQPLNRDQNLGLRAARSLRQ